MISTNVHGAMDYLLGLVLIVSPWLFGFAIGGAAMWIPIILGIVLILYSMFTNYERGVVRMMSVSTHLTLDIIFGLFLAISPWLFGFNELVWAPHLILGLLESGTAMVTRRVPGEVRTP